MSPKKDAILRIALNLFKRQGFKATGIDQILKEAGVAKMTLYHHFASKDALIIECLKVHADEILAGYKEALEQMEPHADRRFWRVFDPLKTLLQEETFAGCAFVRAAGEYPATEDPAHQQAIRVKNEFRALFELLAKDARIHNPAHAAQVTQILFDGVMALAQVESKPALADTAVATLKHLFGRAAFSK